MEIILTGCHGGIGSAIKERLKEHELTYPAHVFAENVLYWEYEKKQYNWLICAHGVLDESNVYDTFITNVMSTIELVEEVKTKNVIFISSTSGIKGNDKYPIYSASKAALNMYAKLKGYYVVCPGATDTKMFRKLGLDVKPQSPDVVAELVEQIINGMYPKGSSIKIKDGICEILT